MYRKTSESGNYLERVASHATKPSATGRIDDIPKWAQEPEEYYNSLKEQYALMQDMLAQLTEEYSWTLKQLRNTLPFEEFKRLDEHRYQVNQLRQALQEESGGLRKAVVAAGQDAWGIVWRLCAQQRLDATTFAAIETEAGDLLGRRFDQTRERYPVSPETKKRRNRLATLRAKLRGVSTHRKEKRRALDAPRKKKDR